LERDRGQTIIKFQRSVPLSSHNKKTAPTRRRF
jgi:hypothetical protein